MRNAFVAGLKNEAPRGRDITKEDRNSEVSTEGSEFSYRNTDHRSRIAGEGRYVTPVTKAYRWSTMSPWISWRGVPLAVQKVLLEPPVAGTIGRVRRLQSRLTTRKTNIDSST